MKNVFNIDKRHSVTEANINYYSNPFIHPKRKMNQHDFIYIVDGEWKIGQNENVYELEKDTLLILGANNLHYGAGLCSPNTKTMYFHISCEDGDRIVNDDYLCSENEIITDVFLKPALNKKIKESFFNVVNCKLQGNQRKSNLFFELLLYELSETCSYAKNEGVASKIKTIIHNNPETFFSNRTLAKMVNVSVKTAETKFKELFGTTIHKYILEFKTEQSIQYFKNFPDMTTKEISFNLGFYDEFHFSKQFKKITGKSPKDYRKHLKP